MRGIIPRVLTFLFDEFERRQNTEYNMYISFMEIYNETAFDLLDRKHLELPMESWNKVTLHEDDGGNIHLRNLSVHQCFSEQDGIDLLMMGNFIRQVSSTPLNQSSSRSHCIFTLAFEGKEKNAETYFVSKLHLVDLAGSERISKTQVEGNLLTEAKYINLSLTYLEQVIVALHEKRSGARQHIPYRNSLMTTILKDSLGGNCKTVMIATLSGDVDNLEETISTARFAQRCSQLENEIKKNEKVDLNVLVQKLEKENYSLQQELESYKSRFGGLGEAGKKKDRKMTQIELLHLNDKVEAYMNENLETLEVRDLNEAQACFFLMRAAYTEKMNNFLEELNTIRQEFRKYQEASKKFGGSKKTDKSTTNGGGTSSESDRSLLDNLRGGQGAAGPVFRKPVHNTKQLEIVDNNLNAYQSDDQEENYDTQPANASNMNLLGSNNNNNNNYNSSLSNQFNHPTSLNNNNNNPNNMKRDFPPVLPLSSASSISNVNQRSFHTGQAGPKFSFNHSEPPFVDPQLSVINNNHINNEDTGDYGSERSLPRGRMDILNRQNDGTVSDNSATLHHHQHQRRALGAEHESALEQRHEPRSRPTDERDESKEEGD
eukprot:TRINITY_DN3210_c0_g1_i8.p1 TRINITY_DN3210_c0_g1~~TRINITY_DN3210_c0_g1_i8.p1  ORF type:complete len:633 (-),score=177.49 TRINITY_DN3210_c0_g1_i8:277-2082(-)